MRAMTLALLVAVMLGALHGCSPPEADGDADGDGDADADTDGDTDTDGDGDADADTDGDTDGDGDADTDGDGDADADGVCDEVSFDISLQTPDMLILLDRSNSMDLDGLWDPVREAIEGVTAALESRIWFGLMIFPNTLGDDACQSPDQHICVAAREPEVDCGPETAGEILGVLMGTEPCGGTPVASSLGAARTYLEDLQRTTGHPGYVVLATDGAPNCNMGLDGATCTCTAPDPPGCDPLVFNCLDDERTYRVIDDLRAAGIGLFVIGISVSEWRDVLDEMALRGGTGRAVMADEPETIQSAFEEITGAVSSCEFELGSPDPSADPDLVNFYFDGVPVPLDVDGDCSEGWVWVDPEHTRVRFCGSHCAELRDGNVAEVRATFGCPTLI